MYVCGPTVYNYIHIGNARSVVAFDTVRRYLEFKGYQVNYVFNFTDVDDKMIKAAAEQGITVPELAEKIHCGFYGGHDGPQRGAATLHPRATENIAGIIEVIEALIKQGYAYEAAGDVYYGPASLPTTAPFPGNRWTRWKSGPVSTSAKMKWIKEDPLGLCPLKRPNQKSSGIPRGANGAAWLASNVR